MAKSNKGNLFNLSNLEQAKGYIKEIYDLMHKTIQSAEEWMDYNERMVDLYRKLKNASADLFKQDESAVNARSKNFQQEIDTYYKMITAREQQIQQEIDIRTEVEKRLDTERQISKEQEGQLQTKKKDIDETKKYVRQLVQDSKTMGSTLEKFNLTDVFQTRNRAKQNDLNQRKSDAAKKWLDDWTAKNGNITEDNYEQVSNMLQKSINKEFGRESTKLALAAEGLSVAAESIKKAATVWVGVAKTGLNKQNSVYEDTFQNISVRNGTTRGQYYSAHSAINNTLFDMGLRSNIASSDVQQMWNTMSDAGIAVDLSEQATTTKAIENVLTKQIVPYLDTGTAQWDQLTKAQPELQKNIRGINQLNKDIVGNNYATNKLVQTILDDMQPMADSALMDLAMESSEATAAVNTLMAAGMDQPTAEKYYTDNIYKQRYYGAEIMRSGTTAEKYNYSMNTMDSEHNMYDSKDTGYFIAQNVKRNAMFANMGPGNTSTMNGLTQSVVNSAFGLDPREAAYLQNMNVDELYQDILNNTDKAKNNYKNYGNTVTQEFKDDQNQTNKQLQNITVENLMNELSVINNWMGNWADVIVTAIKGIGSLLTVWLGGKVVSGIGGKLLGGAGGNVAAKALGGAGVAGALEAFAGTSVGYNLMGSGAALGINSIPLATAAGIGGVAAGIGGAAYGISKGVGQLKDGETGLGVTNLAGGAAMGVGAGLLLASNPVGWAVGAVGGIAMAGAAVYDAVQKHNESMSDSIEYYNKQTQEYMADRKKSQQEEIDNLEYYQDIIKKSGDAEYSKRLIVEAGIATEEELSDKKYDEISAINDLVDTYINNKKKINEETNAVTEELIKLDNENKSKYANAARDKMEEAVGGWGWNKEYGELSEEDKAMQVQTANALWEFFESNKDSLSKEQNEIYDVFKNYRADFESKSIQDNADAMNAIINVYDKHNNEAKGAIKAALGNDDILTNFVLGDRGTKALKSVGIFDKYVSLDENKAGTLLESMLKSDVSDEQVRSYLDEFKLATNITDINKLPEDTRQKIQGIMEQHHIDKYRQGTDNIPYDNYPALLHEGEAVLTASTASELRNLIDEYRQTNTQSVNIDAIIQTQTNALITEMERIIQVIQAGTSNTNNVRENKFSDKIMSSMTAFRNTKSMFN